MKKATGSICSIIVLLILCSGIFVNIVDFFLWFFTLQNSLPEISVAAGIIARFLTFAVSYSLVGIAFNAFGPLNGKAMKILYFVISTLLGFVFAYIVWCIEQYILIIAIVMGIIASIAIIFLAIRAFLNKRKKPKVEEDEED